MRTYYAMSILHVNLSITGEWRRTPSSRTTSGLQEDRPVNVQRLTRWLQTKDALGSFAFLLPVLIVFVFNQRYFVRVTSMSGLKA